MSRGPAQWIRLDGVDAPGSGPTIGVDSSTPRQALAALDPEQIGPYRILGRIGEGGMATVYKAEQRDPVRRIVALKVIKLGMDSKQVVARFEAERQALALMNHPNVAKVFEAGMTDGGRPYFAMEFVPGVPITRFCDDSRLTLRQRIELFIPVCQAVQHAHQKGIIHRDLKPGNILVQLFEGEPVPKVIDFGIAKATNQSLTQHTLHTEVGSMLGTPEYMSPEQAQTSGLDVDTRTDIYSLGVILYQLLTGTLPFDPKQLRSGGPEGIVRTLRESEPPRPSTRVGSIEKIASEPGPASPRTRLATSFGADASALCRKLRGDLDWIVLKAMEKDRSRRYETANALAMDLKRYLDEDPIAARPPTTFYRVQKFTRKHRVGVLTALGLLAALLLSLAAVTSALVRASHDRDEADSQKRIALHQTQVAQQERAQAQESARRVERVDRFLEQMLADISSVAAQDVMPQQSLDRIAREVEQGALSGDPAAQRRVRLSLARRYEAMGFYQRAATQLQSVLTLVRADAATDDSTLVESLNDLAEALTVDGQTEAVEQLLVEARTRCETGSVPPAAVATTSDLLGVALADRGKYSDAQTAYDQAIRIRQKLPQAIPALLDSRMHVIELRLASGQGDPAATFNVEQVLTTYRQVYAANPQAMVGPLRILARSAARRGDRSSAHQILQAALATGCRDRALLADIVDAKAQLLLIRPDDATLRKSHMAYAGRIGEFATCETDSLALLKQRPDDADLWQRHLTLLLQLNDLDAYQHAREEALGRFGASRDPLTLHRIAKGALIYPLDGQALLLASNMADTANRLDSSQLFYWQTKGMAEYRAGHYREAVTWLEKCKSRGILYLDIACDYYLAMAHARAGEKEKAEQAMDEATNLWNSDSPKVGEDDLVHPEDWVLCSLAAREAGQVLHPAAATKAVVSLSP